MEKEFTTIQIRRDEHKKLESYKEYGSEPMWHVIKNILDNKKMCRCGHNINLHDFSHKGECRYEGCKCEEFINEVQEI